jgi:hypothetical protein
VLSLVPPFLAQPPAFRRHASTARVSPSRLNARVPPPISAGIGTSEVSGAITPARRLETDLSGRCPRTMPRRSAGRSRLMPGEAPIRTIQRNLAVYRGSVDGATESDVRTGRRITRSCSKRRDARGRRPGGAPQGQEAAATWPDDRIATVWIVRDTAPNRALLARYPHIVDAAFPGSSRGWVRALIAGRPPPAESGIVWFDASTGRLIERRRATIGP